METRLITFCNLYFFFFILFCLCCCHSGQRLRVVLNVWILLRSIEALSLSHTHTTKNNLCWENLFSLKSQHTHPVQLLWPWQLSEIIASSQHCTAVRRGFKPRRISGLHTHTHTLNKYTLPSLSVSILLSYTHTHARARAEANWEVVQHVLSIQFHKINKYNIISLLVARKDRG